MLRKWSETGFAIASLSFLVVGCGSGGSNSGNSASSASTTGPVTITVAAWNDAADSLKAEIPGFEKQYPNIKVQVDYVDNQYVKITPELASGTNVQDIIQTQNRDFPAFMKKFPGEFVDITNQVGDLQSKFVTSAWTPVTQGGHIYAMPWDLGPAAVYYRKDLFAEAGIDASKIAMWNDYIAAGKTLTQHFKGKTMMTGFAYSSDFDLYEELLNELGGNYVTVDGSVDISSTKSKQALSMMKQMKDAGITMNIPDWNSRITDVQNDRIASIIYPVWYAGTLMNSVKDQSGKWGLIPLPAFTAGGNNQANLGGSVLAITKQSKHADAAVKFLRYCLATDAGQTVMLNYGLFPSYTPFYDNGAFKQNVSYFNMAIYPFFANQSKNIPSLNHGPIMLDAGKSLDDMIGSVLIGSASVDSATNAAAQEIAKSTGLTVNQQ